MLELSRDFAGAWERFEGLESLRLLEQTHEWEWTRGRTDLFAFLAAVSDEPVQEYLAGLVSEIEDIPGIDPYPERYWHVTIKVVGFLAETPSRDDEVSLKDVERLAEAARPALEACPQFDVRAGPVNGFPEVVFAEVHDGGAVRTLNQRLLEVPGLQRYPVDGEMFLPHISIARFASNEGLSELKTTLARLREEAAPGPTFRVESALLIRAHLAREAPTFDLVAEYPLRG
jgi:2'-5' RNA ligase